MWSIKNYLGKTELRVITNDDMFEISGDKRPQSKSHYGNHLKIHDCSFKKLNETMLYCGSHVNPEEIFFYLKVCGMLFEL